MKKWKKCIFWTWLILMYLTFCWRVREPQNSKLIPFSKFMLNVLSNDGVTLHFWWNVCPEQDRKTEKKMYFFESEGFFHLFCLSGSLSWQNLDWECKLIQIFDSKFNLKVKNGAAFEFWRFKTSRYLTKRETR